MIAQDYFNQLVSLLPKGPAWPIENGFFNKLLTAWSIEFARIDAEVDRLITETDPRTTVELLPDYERVFGLPTDCMIGQSQTLDQRHAALVSQMTNTGGQSAIYIIQTAANAGYTITITEYRIATVGMYVNDPLYDDNWQYAFCINAPLNAINYMTVASGVDEPFSSWSNVALECLINRIKPAHTISIFSYT